MSVATTKNKPRQKDEEPMFNDSIISHLYSTSIRYCSFCEKRESDDDVTEKFSVCSKCKLANYCSRDCQVKHWNQEKNGHKEECKKNKKKSNFEQLTDKEKLSHFKEQFQPLLCPLALWHFYRFTGTDYGRSAWLGMTHVLCVELKETSHEAASSPLYIHQVYLQKIANQSVKLKMMLLMSRKSMPSNAGPNDATGFIKLSLVDAPDPLDPDDDLFEIHPNLFGDAFKTDFVDANIAQSGKTSQRKAYQHRADMIYQQINAMAKGTAPSSLKAANKGKVS